MSRSITPRKKFQLGIPWRQPRQSLLNELESLFSNVLGDDDEGWPCGRLAPSLDLSETENSIEARMDLPGVSPADIEIRINGDVLTISGERKEDTEEEQRTYHHVERRAGSFSRTVRLPCVVEESKVVANQKEGVLTVSMPKLDKARGRKVKVNG